MICATIIQQNISNEGNTMNSKSYKMKITNIFKYYFSKDSPLQHKTDHKPQNTNNKLRIPYVTNPR